MVGGIIVDDHNQILDVQTSSCHRGGYEEIADVCLEVMDCGLSIHLILASMQRQAGIAYLHLRQCISDIAQVSFLSLRKVLIIVSSFTEKSTS